MEPAVNNPWRMLDPKIQNDLQRQLLDDDVYTWFGNSSTVPKDIPGARSFNDWYNQYYGPSSPRKGTVDRKSVFPEWRFNHGLTFEQRNSLLCVYGKLKAEGLWSSVKSVHWVGATGEILFVPTTSPEAFRQFLLTRGYGDWWLASHNCKWGVRSRFRGAQLHFRGIQGDVKRVNAHIDIHNPGDPTAPGAASTGWLEELPQAIQHLSEDDHRRAVTHVPTQLRTALEAEKIRIPKVP